MRTLLLAKISANTTGDNTAVGGDSTKNKLEGL